MGILLSSLSRLKCRWPVALSSCIQALLNDNNALNLPLQNLAAEWKMCQSIDKEEEEDEGLKRTRIICYIFYEFDLSFTTLIEKFPFCLSFSDL